MLELVLAYERARVSAEVAADRARGACRQEALAEQRHDRERPEDERDADERELEEREAPGACVGGGVGDDHVHRRSGQREQRAGVRAERERQQQLRRRAADPDRRHDDDGQERRDGPV